MNTLPSELIIYILGYSDYQSCQAISQASSEYRWILNEEKLWTSFGDNYHGYVLTLARRLLTDPNKIRYLWNIKRIHGYFGLIGIDMMTWLYKNGRFVNGYMKKIYARHYHYCACTHDKTRPLEEIWLKNGLYKPYIGHRSEFIRIVNGEIKKSISPTLYTSEFRDVSYKCDEGLLICVSGHADILSIHPEQLHDDEISGTCLDILIGSLIRTFHKQYWVQ